MWEPSGACSFSASPMFTIPPQGEAASAAFTCAPHFVSRNIRSFHIRHLKVCCCPCCSINTRYGPGAEHFVMSQVCPASTAAAHQSGPAVVRQPGSLAHSWIHGGPLLPVDALCQHCFKPAPPCCTFWQSLTKYLAGAVAVCPGPHPGGLPGGQG